MFRSLHLRQFIPLVKGKEHKNYESKHNILLLRLRYASTYHEENV